MRNVILNGMKEELESEGEISEETFNK